MKHITISLDAWGRRRNPDGFGYDNVPIPMFDRGFTLHEHYDDFGLINMNGRLYDPAVGRMLSPDIVIQQEHNSQAYNRYSYCFNNPLRFTDPSGYVVDIPPEYFEIENLIKNNETETLKEMGITGYSTETVNHTSYDTEDSQGITMTTTKWICDGVAYQMETITHLFDFYEQHYVNSCVAASVSAQERRLGGNDNHLSEDFIMTCFPEYRNELGIAVKGFTKEFTTNYSGVFSDRWFHNYSSFKDPEGYVYNEMSKNNGVSFDVRNNNYIGLHYVNAVSASKLSVSDGTKAEYEIQIWDSDFINGRHGGVKQLSDYQNLIHIITLINKKSR